MPLTASAARALRTLDVPLWQDEPERRYARALAWLGRDVTVALRSGASAHGTVEGVATIPQVRVEGVEPGVLLIRRGGAVVDVLEGYVLSTIVSITDSERRPSSARAPVSMVP